MLELCLAKKKRKMAERVIVFYWLKIFEKSVQFDVVTLEGQIKYRPGTYKTFTSVGVHDGITLVDEIPKNTTIYVSKVAKKDGAYIGYLYGANYIFLRNALPVIFFKLKKKL